MRYLADTHALIWFLSGSRRLSRPARLAFEEDEADIYVSAASAWEIATKHRLGKLPDVDAMMARPIEETMTAHGFITLAVGMNHAERAGGLNDPHRDPFDRMLVAQALTEGLILISNETVFDRFRVRRVW